MRALKLFMRALIKEMHEKSCVLLTKILKHMPYDVLNPLIIVMDDMIKYRGQLDARMVASFPASNFYIEMSICKKGNTLSLLEPSVSVTNYMHHYQPTSRHRFVPPCQLTNKTARGDFCRGEGLTSNYGCAKKRMR